MSHPRQTLELVGHKVVCQDLINRFHEGNLPHALLFMGAQGIGKATTAYHLAYALFKGLKTFDGCIPADDPLHRRLAAQSHGDILVLERVRDVEGKLPRDITVENARKVAEFLSKTSLEGGWRIIIIDSIDEMNRQAMNAILKGLEEPPARCLFILICHQVGRLLPTILSRCQRVLFAPLKGRDLHHVIQHKGYTLSQQQEQFIDQMAEGSAGRALRFLQFEGDQLYPKLEQAVHAVAQGNWEQALQIIKYCTPSAKAEKSVENFTLLGELLGYYLHSSIQALIHEPSSPKILPLFRERSLDHWTEVWEKIQALFREGERLSLDPFQIMVNAFSLLSYSSSSKKV